MEVLNFEMKITVSAILFAREILILLHAIVIDQQKCNHKRDKDILQERCNDFMRVLDSSKQVLTIFSKDTDQKFAIVNTNAAEILL